ncbi:MAG: lamin tail domain-containing protein, partial [Phycisphaerales bacterium]
STDNYNFVPMDHNTPGVPNAYPQVGPVVISEIMYNPDWPYGGSYVNDQYEYVELHNAGGSEVALYDFDENEPWKLVDGIDFTFVGVSPVTIPAGGYLVVAKNPEAFAWRYPNVPGELVLGPYDGKLSDGGEKVELARPGDVDEFGERQYIRVDRVAYSDGSHPGDTPGELDLWPVAADGAGSSLARINMTLYGNDPNNWTAETPSPAQ